MNNDNFKWTDALVKKFANELYIDKKAEDYIDTFKASNTSTCLVCGVGIKQGASYCGEHWRSYTFPTTPNTSSNEKDWKIECIQLGNKNYWRKQDGLYNSDLFVGGTSSEWLLNNGGTIFQVTRKSDGVVFSVGDKHSGTSYKDRTIEGFILLNNEIIIKQHGGNTLLSDAQPLPNTTSKRPPLGLMPMDIWKEQRLDDINAAIIRYAEANLSIPADWIYERADLLEFITQKK